MADPTLRLVPGRQVWILGRTDRDGASAQEVADMAAGFLEYSFRDVSGGPPGSGANEVFATSHDPLEWRVSAARPIRLMFPPVQSVDELDSSLKASLAGDSPGGDGEVIARREELDPLPLLNASRPWYLALEVWWRGPASTIAWPCLQVTWAGTRQRDYEEADWLLLRAFVPPGSVPDPGGESWGEAAGEAVSAVARKAVAVGRSSLLLVGAGVGIVLVVALASRLRRR